jgi:type II secretory pathway pseudopilin PulG
MRAGSRIPCHPHRGVRQQAGFAYIAVLVALFLASLGTQGVMVVVSQQAQRERENTLLAVGQAYAHAIGAYYQATPGTVKQWPKNLDALLEDKRLVYLKRHLRELYPDPVSRQLDWELVTTADGGIQGVRSRSQAIPIRTGAVDLGDMALPPATRYSDWVFLYQPENALPTPSTTQSGKS